MNENEYWRQLRQRLNSVASSRPDMICGWCDWIEPKRYVLNGPSPRVTGRIGFVAGRDATQFEFALYLNKSMQSSVEIDWISLVPSEDNSDWLVVDTIHKRIDFHPI